jgi:RNA polymerase sigma-70 factor (ECF subfamily)
MGQDPSDTERATDQLLRRAAAGDRQAWEELWAPHHERLRCMIELRLAPRLRMPFNADDVLQEAFVTALRKLRAHLEKDPTIPFYLWLRCVAGQELWRQCRRYLGKGHDVRREVPLDGNFPGASSLGMAERLVGREPRPSEAARCAERARRLAQGLDRLGPLDREVLALRHFEQLSNADAAQVLGMTESAASKRYVRALQKLRDILNGLPGGWESSL